MVGQGPAGGVGGRRPGELGRNGARASEAAGQSGAGQYRPQMSVRLAS